tara:strand:+ start:192 stop:392 length:201 start_codon:yes stop_codon:yes gene_type:complete
MVMSTTTTTVENMITTLTEALSEAEKHTNGNNAAGGRLRKALQNVANTCKDLRKTVQEERNARTTS